MYAPLCLVTPDMWDYHSQFVYILLSLGINRGNVKLVPKIGNFEVQIL